MATSVSFAKDISPLFEQYVANMRWRFDLTDYESVKNNANLIYTQISQKDMPPPPFDPFSTAQIQMFKDWMSQGYPP